MNNNEFIKAIGESGAKYILGLIKSVEGKITTHAGKTSGNPHKVTKADLELDNVENTADADKNVASAATATKWKTARNINGMSVQGDANRVNYGTCSTAAATAAKTVACTGFSLVTGAEITVKFTVTNTASSPTLNVNGTGAKAIYYRGAAITAGYLAANRTYTFRYNGTQYELVGDINVDTTYSNASLGQGYATCSTAAATTAKVGTLSSYKLTTGGIVAVKFTYDVPAGATLNINSKGAKSIYHRGAAITAGVIKAGDIATFIYSSQYHLIAIDRDDDTVTLTGVKGNAESSYRTGNVNITPANIGLGNVNNTSDANKPVSTAQQSAIDAVYAQAIAYADQVAANLINGAPTTLDTLKEIADAMSANEDVVAALDEAVGSKASQAEFDSHESNTTVHITASERTAWNGKLNASGGDSKANKVTFTSGDAEEPTAWTAVSLLTSGLTHANLFNRISTMFKNVRWLYKMLGTTDISAIGDGTATGAISELNNALSNYTTTLWYTLDGWAGIDAKSSKTVEREISIPNSMTIDFVEYNSANGIFMHFWKLVGTNLYVGLFNTTDNNYTLNDTDGIIVHYKLSR